MVCTDSTQQPAVHLVWLVLVLACYREWLSLLWLLIAKGLSLLALVRERQKARLCCGGWLVQEEEGLQEEEGSHDGSSRFELRPTDLAVMYCNAT
jgi:hypothetical protein